MEGLHEFSSINEELFHWRLTSKEIGPLDSDSRIREGQASEEESLEVPVDPEGMRDDLLDEARRAGRGEERELGEEK